MSNLVKQGYIIGDTAEKRVINANAQVEKRLKELKAASQAVRKQGAGMEGEFDPDYLENHAEEIQLPDPEELVNQAREQAAQLLAEARSEAEELVKQAEAERDAIREEARAEGYQEGSNQAMTELEEQKVSLQSEYEEKEAQLSNDYYDRCDKLELELVDTLLPIFEHVITVDLQMDRKIILNLCKKQLEGLDADKNFRVKVSENNYNLFTENRQEFMGMIPESVEVEFVVGHELTDEDCIVETETGMIDCGARTQLKQLAEAIHKLSMS